MALSGIQIYKLLPKTNCKDCGFPTCLAFAMKLAAKQVELASCPHVSEEAKETLAESAAPPIRLITLKSNGYETKAGNEVVLYRHEKTFYHKPGVFIRVKDNKSADEIIEEVKPADSFTVSYVGIGLSIDGFAIESVTDDPKQYASAVQTVRSISKRPVILCSSNPAVIEAGLAVLDNETALIHTADQNNWEAMADLASRYHVALSVAAPGLDEMSALTEKIKEKGVEDLVLYVDGENLLSSLSKSTKLRRLALKSNLKSLGYPLITFPANIGDETKSSIAAVQAITKYAGFIVLDKLTPDFLYPLLVLRENIYTDPQKPIQVLPGIYEINNPTADSPVLVTTNFSITYFSVANEVDGSGFPAWLLITEAEGMSVLTAWAAGKFDAERIAKDVKRFNLAEKVNRKVIVLPGHVAVLSGELEEELPGWEIRVGPREAVHIPAFLREFR